MSIVLLGFGIIAYVLENAFVPSLQTAGTLIDASIVLFVVGLTLSIVSCLSKEK
jgi:hypothetical protein